MKWQTKKLGEVISYRKTKNTQTNLPYVGMEDIESKTGRFIGSLSPKSVKSSTFYFDKSHVLFGRLRPYLNKILLPDFEGHCSTEIFPIKPDELLDKKFLYYWLTSESIIEKINATSTGTRMPRANMNNVLDFEINFPSISEQKRIVKILDEVFEGIEKAKKNTEKNLQNAKELFESYLQSVFANPGNDWRNCLLNDYVNFIDYRGRTPKKTKSGLRLITAKNIKMGYLQREPEEFINPQDYETWMTRGIPNIGDVLFTTEAPLGNVAQLDTDARVAFAQRTIIFKPDTTKLTQTFLKYLVMSPQFQKKINEKGTGATVKGIKASLLKKIPISFPSISEQKSIVAKLDALSEQTKKLESIYQQKLDALEELKKSVLALAFAGEL